MMTNRLNVESEVWCIFSLVTQKVLARNGVLARFKEFGKA